MSLYNNEKIERQFRRFQQKRKMISNKVAAKNPNKYPFIESFTNERVEFVFLYNDEWFIVQLRDENKKTKFVVPFETMQPIEATLESAEQILFEHIEGLE